jgi:hypothetical protein
LLLKLIWSVLSMLTAHTRACATGANANPARIMGTNSFTAFSILQSLQF